MKYEMDEREKAYARQAQELRDHGIDVSYSHLGWSAPWRRR